MNRCIILNVSCLKALKTMRCMFQNLIGTTFKRAVFSVSLFRLISLQV